MATIRRLGAALVSVLLAGATAAGQPPTAPPPHPALGEVAAEYLRLGLPVPPPDADLVRAKSWPGEPDESASYTLAFRIAPADPDGAPRYFIACGNIVTRRYLFGGFPERVAPAAVVAERVVLGYHDRLCLAVHCHLRGWDDLGHALYREALEHFHGSPVRYLRELTWSIWQAKLGGRGTDRADVYRHLAPLAESALPDFTEFLDRRELLRRLELTLAPRTSKPGTAEALIDDLVNYHDDLTDESGREAYWKLVGMGFGAVPALLDHLRDERLTYAVTNSGRFEPDRAMLVGHLAGEILHRLAAGAIGGAPSYIFQHGVWLDPRAARKWWETAKRVGEEKWLRDHRTAPGFIFTGSELVPNENVLRALGVKYPEHLRRAYLTALRETPAGSWGYIRPILASALSRADKTALLVKGAGDANLRTRVAALDGLARFDPALFRKHLLLTLNEAAGRVKHEGEWRDDADAFTPLLERTRDRECWDAFAAVVKAAPYGDRTSLLVAVAWVADDTPDPVRRERVRFLVGFLDDRSVGRPGGDSETVEVRDYATSQLMRLLDVPAEPMSGCEPAHDEGRGPLTRIVYRAAVRRAAAAELARPVK